MELVDILESNDFIVHEMDGGMELEWFTPLGEDHFVYLNGDNEKELAKSFITEVEVFDPEEHVAMLMPFRGKHGVPKSVRALLNDADAIDEHLTKVAEVIERKFL